MIIIVITTPTAIAAIPEPTPAIKGIRDSLFITRGAVSVFSSYPRLKLSMFPSFELFFDAFDEALLAAAVPLLADELLLGPAVLPFDDEPLEVPPL